MITEEKTKKLREAYKSLEKGVDYKMVKTDIKAPLKVYEMIPLSDKAKKFLDGKY